MLKTFTKRFSRSTLSAFCRTYIVGKPFFAGQASVEGAFLTPVIQLLLMLLIRPSIVLYDRMVMQAAAAEGCRLLATKSSDAAGDNVYEEYIRQRLAAVPQEEHFHVHDQGCSWDISLEGDETSVQVCVRIENQIKPLPLFDAGMTLLGLTNGAGYITQTVELVQDVKSSWVQASDIGLNPDGWIAYNKEEAEGA